MKFPTGGIVREPSGRPGEIVKILIKLITVGTNSNYVGEFSNLIGAFMFILPIWFVSRRMPSNKKGMAASLATSARELIPALLEIRDW